MTTLLSPKRVMKRPSHRIINNRIGSIRIAGFLLSVLLGISCFLSLYAQENAEKSAQENDVQLYLPSVASSSQTVAMNPGDGTSPEDTAPPVAVPTPVNVPPPADVPPADVPPADTSASAIAEFLLLLNQERQLVDCAPFTLDPRLTGVAQAHSEEMGLSLTHSSTDGSLPGKRLEQAGYTTGYWGENLGISSASSSQYPTAEMATEVVDGWLEGTAYPFYAENIRLCEFTQIGIGVHAPAATTPGATSFIHSWVVVFAGPLESSSTALTVDTSDRAQVAELYRDRYLPTLEVPTGWDGNQLGCHAGTTSAEYREAIRFQINYFRAMAGVPANIIFDEEYNQLSQAASLIMSANQILSHNPAPTSLCYSESGERGAGSNLYKWFTSSSLSPIAVYVDDYGDNEEVLHRRWLLMPEQYVMGTGTVDQRIELLPKLPYANTTYVQSNWIIAEKLGDGYRGILQSSAPEPFVTWPPAGYVPNDLIYSRWSIQHHHADFQKAQVQVTLDGVPVPIKVEYVTESAFVGQSLPASALVWVPQVDWATLDMSKDHQVQVEIKHIEMNGERENFSYEVNIFAPEVE